MTKINKNLKFYPEGLILGNNKLRKKTEGLDYLGGELNFPWKSTPLPWSSEAESALGLILPFIFCRISEDWAWTCSPEGQLLRPQIVPKEYYSDIS